MWNTILLDQLDPTDPEDAEVRAIILRVQQKALKHGGNLANFNEESSQRVDTHPEPVTILLPVVAKPDGRNQRRKYASHAERQRAYRERKAALQHESTL
jgi:hypothetical protein